MPRKSKPVLTPVVVERMISVIRGQRVMLDAELAELYGVTTKALNQSVERNPERFPDDFSFTLTDQEHSDLRSQIAASNSTHGGRRYAPRVFTEHGVAMLSSVLRSPLAARVNVEIIRVFVRLRRLMATPGELVTQIQALAETVQLHDGQIRKIADVIQKMLEPAPAPPVKPKIGFHAAKPDPNAHPADGRPAPGANS